MQNLLVSGLKKGVWQQYPKRMLQHRARGFAAKDCFPDALYGLMSEQEAHDVADSKKVTPVPSPKSKGMAGLEEALDIEATGEMIRSLSSVTVEPIENVKLT